MRRIVSAVLLIGLLAGARLATAQTVMAGADLLFYGDNTEFANPFRTGDTLLGTAGRLFVAIELNDTVTIRGGLFANGRYGAHEFVEEGEPMIALALRRGRSTFIFGSLDTMTFTPEGPGPEVETPHGLLPPLQRETLTFERAHEMGLQWRVARPDLDHDVWINWQRLNTPAHRERFDAGYRGRAPLGAGLALHTQWHIVHEGGQQFASGLVRDSQGSAVGLEWSGRGRSAVVSVDAHAVVTRDVPDRERPDRAKSGIGAFARIAITRGPWRAHAIVWRGGETLKEEGDPNYHAERRNGTRFRKTRDYAELGLTRHFRPAPGVHVSASARLHRVESQYEYSYRIVARVPLRYRLK